jgi:hypothetical protein
MFMHRNHQTADDNFPTEAPQRVTVSIRKYPLTINETDDENKGNGSETTCKI